MLTRTYLLLFILLFASCNTEDNQADANMTGNIPAPQPITFSIDAVYPHDTTAFTQGLQFYKGKLYESTGEFKNSTLRIVDPKTGKVEENYLIPDSIIFGEGITIFKNKIYQLTWENNKIFVYDIGNISKPIKTLNWPYEGWGITNDGTSLIISDGSDKLYYVVPDEEKNNMKQLKIISVADNTGSIDRLNELEYIDGFIYANRWQTDQILKIDTSNGQVTGSIDLTGILAQYAAKDMNADADFLNGIAYDSATKKLYITGKRWPKIFEIKLNK